MSTLAECKGRIDGGEVAELVLRRRIRINTDFYDGTAITIFRNAIGYVWSLYRIAGKEKIRVRRDQYGTEWRALILRIEGEQTTSSDWTTRPKEQSDE